MEKKSSMEVREEIGENTLRHVNRKTLSMNSNQRMSLYMGKVATDLGSSSFSIVLFCLLILFMGFSRQEY